MSRVMVGPLAARELQLPRDRCRRAHSDVTDMREYTKIYGNDGMWRMRKQWIPGAFPRAPQRAWVYTRLGISIYLSHELD